MISAEALQKLTARIEIEYHGEKIEIWYFTEKWFEEGFRERHTPATPEEGKAEAASEDRSEGEILAEGIKRERVQALQDGRLFSELICRWTIAAHEGSEEMQPITAEYIASLSLPLRRLIGGAIMADMVNPTKANNSPNG